MELRTLAVVVGFASLIHLGSPAEAQDPPARSAEPGSTAAEAAEAAAAAAAEDAEERGAEGRGRKVVSEAITVSATRAGERSVYDLPLSVSVLPREEIEASPARTPDELLRGVAGVQLQLVNSTSGFPAIPGVAIRGLGLGDGATRTLVLLDGLPMNGAFFGNVFWNRVPNQNVERVEVLRGASSSLFGSFAMGGVVHLLTRPVPDRSQLGLDGRYGTDDTFQGNVYGSHRGDRFGLSLNANYFETGGYHELAAADRGPIDVENGSDFANLQGRLRGEPTSGTVVSLRANVFEQDQHGATVLGGTTTDVRDLSAGVQALLDPKSSLGVDLYFLDEEFHTDNISTFPEGTRDNEFVSNAHDTPSEDFGGSAQWTRRFDGKVESFTVGVDYRSIDGFDDAEIFLADGSLFQTKRGEGKQQSIGIFAEVSFAPRDDLEVLLSLRRDSFDNTDGRDVTNGVVTAFPDQGFDDLNPRLAVRFQATDEVAVRGAVYGGFRSPTLSELYRAFGTAEFQGLPNSQLEPETLEGAELGLDVGAGPFYGQVNAFYNEVENFVGGVAVAFDPVFTLQNFNIGRIETRGLELIGEVRFNPIWTLAASYTYLDAEITDNIDDPSVVGNRVEGAPENAASLRLGYARSRGLAVTFRGRFVDEQFQDSSNATRLPPHTVFDLYVAHPVGSMVEVYGTAENLFDREYTADAFGGLDHRAPPRQVSVGVRVGFE
jgi:outer membrane receptor protein involved in Fe transport